MIATQTMPEVMNDQSEFERDDIYVPTPQEIQSVCAQIQSEWTEAERARRARGQAGRQRTVPVSMKRFARLLLDRNSRDGWAA